MARLSRQTKETIKIVAVVLGTVVLIFLYWIYPLNRAKTMWGRVDIDSYQPDSLLSRMNDPGIFSDFSVVIDTFRVESDGSTSLACLYLSPQDEATIRGTVILLHSDRENRNSLASIAGLLADSGFGVVVYDQRASGMSTGKYHSDGRMEAADLEAVIGYLGLHDQLTVPVIVAGWKIGADAAIYAASEEKRISAVLAIEPYLSSNRIIDSYRAEFSSWWFPLYRTAIWFWFNARSSYGLEYVDADDLSGVACRTVLMTNDNPLTSQAAKTLTAKSGTLLTLTPANTDVNKLVEAIVTLALPSNRSNQ